MRNARSPRAKRVLTWRGFLLRLSCFIMSMATTMKRCGAKNASIGFMVPLHWNGPGGSIESSFLRNTASAAMAAHHINNRVASLVPMAEELLPAGFKLDFDIQDSMAQPSVAVNHAVAWNEEGRHAIIGSYRSAVTGPLALVASISSTPVIVWAAAASTLSDRSTYPTLSRTVIHDGVSSEKTIQAVSSMGWTRIAVLFVNDAWGRAFAQDASGAAMRAGVEIVVAAGFAIGDRPQIEDAVRQISEAGAKITLCIAFGPDLATVAEIADSAGLLTRGHAWILAAPTPLNNVVAESPDPQQTRERLTGWLVALMDQLDGERGREFQSVLEAEPLEHLNHSIMEGALTDDVIRSEACDLYCGTAYDAVWTAAIAIGRVGVGADGSVDKEALLREIRNVSFEGATGRVRYDGESGERDAAEQPLRLWNVQQVAGADGAVSLSTVAAWRWQSGRTLEREGEQMPVWPGGEWSWELPVEVLECERGSVFSTASLQCEPCPRGTEEEGGQCVRYHASVGVVVPLRWGGADGPMEAWAVRSAASAAMAAHHINNRVASLVPMAEELLPAGFKLVFDIQDSMAQPSVAVNHAVAWNEEGRHAIIGSYRSAVTGPLALAASISSTPVVVWGATASTLADRSTYPTLSRTIVHDGVLAASVIKGMVAMGFTRFAILHVNDAYGRGFAQDAASAASEVGLQVVVSSPYETGDVSQIVDAVARIAESGARITLCIAFPGEIASIAEAADRFGLLGTGHAWITTTESLTEEAVQSNGTSARTAGWFSVAIDTWRGEPGERFQRALEGHEEPHPEIGALAAGDIEDSVASAPCNQYCGTAYDAVWTAAIAIGRVGVGADGSVDKEALLREIRNVSFEGATGRVEYDPQTGERLADELPLVINNLQPTINSNGTATATLVATWKLQSGVLSRISTEPPLWPGHTQAWELPVEVLECERGSVFSTASLQCEPCPRGTEEEGGQCVRYHASVGVVVPLRWGGADGPMEAWAVRSAASAAMAAHHINNRVASLVPMAEELLPAGFKLVFDIQDSMAQPSVAVNHAVAWNEEGRHAIIGSYRSAVTGPLALAASISSTPVVVWGATASTLADRSTYPTLSRTIVHDGVLAAATIRAISAMGWRRIAVLYVNDAYGRAYLRDALAEAREAGVDVVAPVGFTDGAAGEIEQAVRQIADSGARIVLVAALDRDLPAVLDSADRHGLLNTGYAWLASGDVSWDAVAAASSDPHRARQQLTGWMMATMDTLGDGRDRFLGVLQSQPLADLNHSAYQSLLTQEVINGPCDQFCGIIYDAVWTAAIAIGRVGVGADGSVDKEALLREIRNVSFEGATGRVRYDGESGERDAAEQPLRLWNVQQVAGADGAVSLSTVAAWRWQSGRTLEREGEQMPVWPGGEWSWELPVEVLECERGSVFSTASLQCEPCPRGTEEEGGQCVRYHASVGVVVPLRWGGADGPMEAWAVRSAASAAMAAHHINNRVASLVPMAEELLPAGFKLVFDIQDSMAQPSVAVNHAVAWNEEGRHAIIGSYRSAVTGPLALAASISSTPVVVWGATASSLADRSMYPTLSRTVVHDGVFAALMLDCMRALGWERAALIYVADSWGRSFAQDLSSAAIDKGIAIEISVGFTIGVVSEIEAAVELIAQSGARVVISVAFDADLAMVANAADRLGMLAGAHAWLAPYVDFNNVVAMSPHPQKTAEQLLGWLAPALDPFTARGDAFEEAFESEPVQHLNTSAVLAALTPQALKGGRCDQFCAHIYDAMWSVAIACSRVGVAADGAVDKEALRAALRGVSFEGASGLVQFDPATGERNPKGQPLLLHNVRASSRRSGNLTLSSEVVWQWLSDGAGGGALSAQSEDPPTWPGGARSWEPPADALKCPAGWVAASASECRPCPAGTRLVGSECQDCPLGSFSAHEGAVQCARCQIGFANESGLAACHACPANTVRSAGSDGVSIDECLCVVGFYSREGRGQECLPCIPGGVCEGGDQAPYPVEGFWADASCERLGGNQTCDDWDTFIPCVPAENCKGGPHLECHRGRVGRLCLETTDGFSNVGGVFFWSCGKNGKLITVAGMAAVVVVWFAINHFAACQYQALNIALLFVQTTALIGSFGLRWHTNLHWINISMGVANFDVDFVSAACLMPWGPVTSFYFQLALPFIFGTAYAIRFLLVELWRCRRDEHRINWQRMRGKTLKYFVSFVLINYTTLAIKCFQPWRCGMFPDGRQYMQHAPSVECWAQSHWFMLSLSTMYILVLLIGLPLRVCLILRNHIKQGTLHDVATEKQWGFFHVAFEADFKYWELVLVLRRFCIAFVAVVLPEPLLQGAATLILLACMLSAQVFTSPFIRADIDVLDFLCLCGSSLYCLSGMLFYVSMTGEAQGRLCSEQSVDEYCVRDQYFKQVVSWMSFMTIVFMVAVSVGITIRNILEKRASELAASNIRRLQGCSREASLSRVSASTNRVSLDEILTGQRLLKWSKILSHQEHSSKYVASSVQFLELQEELLRLDVDLTQSATHPTAMVMRHLCDLPGFVDYLLTAQERGAEGLHSFVHDMAAFLQRAEETSSKFAANDLIRFEHRPFLCYWLASATDEKRRLCQMLVEAIQQANSKARHEWHHPHALRSQHTFLDAADVEIGAPALQAPRGFETVQAHVQLASHVTPPATGQPPAASAERWPDGEAASQGDHNPRGHGEQESAGPAPPAQPASAALSLRDVECGSGMYLSSQPTLTTPCGLPGLYLSSQPESTSREPESATQAVVGTEQSAASA